uniref:Transmembrane protein n=2 Tax=Beet leafhopper transmitted virescence phytoplasma TaxID=37694 RepID=Q6JKN0_9MOLU|nr:unknown [Beet leafhopper transmitted virescence phytoplasma]
MLIYCVLSLKKTKQYINIILINERRHKMYMSNLFNKENLYKIVNFVKISCNFIITFSQDLFYKLRGIKDVRVNNLTDLQTAAPLIFNFLIGLLYVYLIINLLSYVIKIYNVIKFIIVCIFTFIQGIFVFITYPLRKLILLTNKETLQAQLKTKEKELLVLRLQNGKYKKQLEQKYKSKR